MSGYLKRILKKDSGSMLGLDISSTSVKLLELSRSGGAFRVENHGLELLPENAVVEKSINDVTVVGEAISRLVSHCNTRVKSAAVAVAGSAVITKTIEMPAELDDAELESRFRTLSGQHIPFPLEDVLFDLEVQGPAPHSEGQVEVLLAACRRENVEMRSEALAIGGLNARVVDIESNCMQRAFGLIEEQFEEDQVIAIIDIGATTTTLSVLPCSGIPYSREQLFGGKQLSEEIQHRYGLSLEEAALAKRENDLPDDYETEVLQPFKEAVIGQVIRSLQFFQSGNTGNEVGHIVLAGGTASISGLAERVTASLGLPCSIANPFRNMTMSPDVSVIKLAKDAPAMMIACGLALRRFD